MSITALPAPGFTGPTTTTPSGIIVPASTPGAAQPATGYSTTSTGILVPVRPTPTTFRQGLVTAQPMTPAEYVAAARQGHADIAKAEGSGFADFKTGSQVVLAERLEADAKRAALIALLEANQMKG